MVVDKGQETLGALVETVERQDRGQGVHRLVTTDGVDQRKVGREIKGALDACGAQRSARTWARPS